MRNRVVIGGFTGLALFGALFAIEFATSKEIPFNHVYCHEGEHDEAAEKDGNTKWAILIRQPWSSSLTCACRAAFTINKFTDTHHDVIIALGTILIGFFTFTLWRSTYKLWEAGEKQIAIAQTAAKAAETSADAASRLVEDAKITARADLRAYVYLDRIVSKKRADIDGTFASLQFSAVWKNYGKTPALNVRVHANCCYWHENKLPNWFPFPDFPRQDGMESGSPSILAPNSEISVQSGSLPIALIDDVKKAGGRSSVGAELIMKMFLASNTRLDIAG